MFKRMAASLIMTSCLASLVSAAGEARRWSVSVNPGYAIPSGKTADTFYGGPSGEVDIHYQYVDFLAVGLAIGISHHKAKPANAVFDIDGDGRSDAVHLDGTLRANLLHVVPVAKLGKVLEYQGFRLRPYAKAGAGYFRSWTTNGTLAYSGTTSSGINLATLPPSAIEGHSNSYLGVLAGLGVDIPLADHFLLGVGSDYKRVFEPQYHSQFFTPYASLTYLF